MHITAGFLLVLFILLVDTSLSSPNMSPLLNTQLFLIFFTNIDDTLPVYPFLGLLTTLSLWTSFESTTQPLFFRFSFPYLASFSLHLTLLISNNYLVLFFYSWFLSQAPVYPFLSFITTVKYSLPQQAISSWYSRSTGDSRSLGILYNGWREKRMLTHRYFSHFMFLSLPYCRSYSNSVPDFLKGRPNFNFVGD